MKTFAELGLAPNFIRALDDLGFENPMPVQEEVIPVLLGDDTDIVALAQTGTGKTAAYGLPILHKLSVEDHYPQMLILSPTRELCVQIANDLVEYAKYEPEIRILPVYGGASIDTQIKAIRKGVHIVVATPGRLVDLINRKVMKLDRVNKVVLDEADEMLNMGFQESIDEIFAEIPDDRNVWLFSATMPKEVAAIARKYMNKPKEITIGVKNAGADTIKHVYYLVHAKDRYLALKRIVDFNPNIYGIIFCRTRRETQEVADKLIQDGYNAESLHGDLSQVQREFVMQKFRIRHFRLLVATDVAARGLDVDDLTHVINFNLPDDLDIYTHRSGRTGRAGKMGVSISILHLKEKHLIRQIENKINKPFVKGRIPEGREICEKQLFNMIDKMEKVEMDNTAIDTFLPAIFRKLEWLEKEDVIKRFVALEFNRFLDYYKNSGDINVSEERQKNTDWKKDRDSERGRGNERTSDRGKDRDRTSSDHRSTEGFTKLVIDQGKADGLYPSNLIELINANTKGKMIPIGKIDLFRDYVLFEVDSAFAGQLMKSMNDAEFRGVSVKVSEADESHGKSERRSPRRSEGYPRSRRNDDNDRGEKSSSGGSGTWKKRDDSKNRKTDWVKPRRRS